MAATDSKIEAAPARPEIATHYESAMYWISIGVIPQQYPCFSQIVMELLAEANNNALAS